MQYGELRTHRGCRFFNKFFLELVSSPPMTRLRQEIDHPRSSSSSSTSELTTSSTMIDYSDHHLAIVSSESVQGQVRGDPYCSETSEQYLYKPSKISILNLNENHEQVLEDLYYFDIREWLQKFREIFWMTEFFNAECNSVRQRRGCILDSASSRGYVSSFIALEVFRWTRILWRVDQRSKPQHKWVDHRSKPHLIKNGVRIQCNLENIVHQISFSNIFSSTSKIFPK